MARGHGHGRRGRRQVPAALRLRRLAGRPPRVGVVVPRTGGTVEPERRERAAARPAHLTAGHPDRRPERRRTQAADRRLRLRRSGRRPDHARRPWSAPGSASTSHDGSFDLPSEPQALRDQGTEALGEYFRELASQAPVLMLLEDLHWADEGTLRWLDAVAPVLADAQVLVVATTRPSLLEDHPRWGEGLAHHVRLTLNPLSRRESRELVRQILRNVEDLPDELVDLVIDSAEGNPFYIEELVTWLIDAGVVVRGEPHWFVVHELVAHGRRTLHAQGRPAVAARRAEHRGAHTCSSARRSSAGSSGTSPSPHLDGDREADVARARARAWRTCGAARSCCSVRSPSSPPPASSCSSTRCSATSRTTESCAPTASATTAARPPGWPRPVRPSAAHDEYAAVIAEHFERAHDPAAATLVPPRRHPGGVRLRPHRGHPDARQRPGARVRRRPAPALRHPARPRRPAGPPRRTGAAAAGPRLDGRAGRPPGPGRGRCSSTWRRAGSSSCHSEYDKARRARRRGPSRSPPTIGDRALRAEATLAQGKALTWAARGRGRAGLPHPGRRAGPRDRAAGADRRGPALPVHAGRQQRRLPHVPGVRRARPARSSPARATPSWRAPPSRSRRPPTSTWAGTPRHRPPSRRPCRSSGARATATARRSSWATSPRSR